MSNLDFSRCRLVPFQHQFEDTEWLIKRPYAFIASEMRTGKTKIVIDAAQFLYASGQIDKVIIVAPAPVRDVWYDPQLGEIAKHAWIGTHHKVVEFHSRCRIWSFGEPNEHPHLDWYVTNYEFLRSRARVDQLSAARGPKTLLVLDESSFVKNHAAQQTKACVQLRNKCGRVVLLNGTPIHHNPLDLFSQGNLLHPAILKCPYITLFKARYAVQQPILGAGGKPITKVIGTGRGAREIIIQQTVDWTNLDDLERRFKPYTVRRLQKDCLDLPPKLDPVTLTATLSTETWRAYRSMRDELVVWFQDGKVAVSSTAAVKVMRLAQITSGFLGGVEDANIDDRPEDGLLEQLDLGDLNGQLRDVEQTTGRDELPSTSDLGDAETDRCSNPTRFESTSFRRSDPSTSEVGREKLDVLLWFIEQRLEEDPNLHLVVWTRFRAELFRIVEAVKEKFPQFAVGKIHGSQKRSDRVAALALLKPETSPKGPVFVAGVEGTGSFGLDMTAAHTCVTISCGYSAGRSAQTLDRVYGPAQKYPIAYFNIVAVGPKGQRTIDHDILLALRNGEDVATRTALAWVARLKEE
jgi:hypothetical protein